MAEFTTNQITPFFTGCKHTTMRSMANEQHSVSAGVLLDYQRRSLRWRQCTPQLLEAMSARQREDWPHQTNTRKQDPPWTPPPSKGIVDC